MMSSNNPKIKHPSSDSSSWYESLLAHGYASSMHRFANAPVCSFRELLWYVIASVFDVLARARIVTRW